MSDKKPLPQSDGHEFAELLSLALRPRDLDREVHDDILARALGASAAAASKSEAEELEATPKEVRRAEMLQRLIEDPRLLASKLLESGSSDAEELRLAALARAFQLAYAPLAIAELAHERIVQRGLKTIRLANVRRSVVAATFVLVAAAAALFGLFIKSPTHTSKTTASISLHEPALPLIEARSVADLFDADGALPRSGGTTERADKIAELRGAELRDNLFSSWGVE